MSEPNPGRNTGANALHRGEFHDDDRTYRVRASSAVAPDSFQVHTGEREDIVLIVSGLNSGDLKATWGPFWRGFKPQWKTWIEESAFRVFYRGHHLGVRPGNAKPAPQSRLGGSGPQPGIGDRRPRASTSATTGRHPIESTSTWVRFCDG